MTAIQSSHAEPNRAERFPWKTLLLLAALTIALAAGLFFAAAQTLLRQEWGGSAVTILAFTCVALPALAGGFAAGKRIGRSGWLYGTLCAVPLTLSLCVVSIALCGRAGRMLAVACALILLCGAAGGILAVNTRRRRRIKQSRKRKR